MFGVRTLGRLRLRLCFRIGDKKGPLNLSLPHRSDRVHGGSPPDLTLVELQLWLVLKMGKCHFENEHLLLWEITFSGTNLLGLT